MTRQRAQGLSVEFLRPWKLATLALGTGLLVIGSFVLPAPDWDVPVSLIMAGFTYLLAPWCMHVMVERRWAAWPLMLVATWWSGEGCYALSGSWRDPAALELMREANAPASLCLYWACGLLWYYNGPVSDMWADARKQLGRLAP